MKSTFKKSLRGIVALTFGAVLINLGCGDDKNPAGPGEEELITTVILTLTETGTTNQATVQFEDLDGDGGNAPVIGTLTLGAGKTYTGTIQLLNESVNPAEDITEEVEAESDAHQFFYTVAGGIVGRVVVAVTDQDANNLPIGLEYTVTVSAGAVASGTLNVELGHFDEVAKDGVTRSPETDIDIDFPVNIQ